MQSHINLIIFVVVVVVVVVQASAMFHKLQLNVPMTTTLSHEFTKPNICPPCNIYFWIIRSCLITKGIYGKIMCSNTTLSKLFSIITVPVAHIVINKVAVNDTQDRNIIIL